MAATTQTPVVPVVSDLSLSWHQDNNLAHYKQNDKKIGVICPLPHREPFGNCKNLARPHSTDKDKIEFLVRMSSIALRI